VAAGMVRAALEDRSAPTRSAAMYLRWESLPPHALVHKMVHRIADKRDSDGRRESVGRRISQMLFERSSLHGEASPVSGYRGVVNERRHRS
jgi:hypothetical protein